MTLCMLCFRNKCIHFDIVYYHCDLCRKCTILSVNLLMLLEKGTDLG